MEIETVVNPKYIAEESLGTDEAEIKILKADVKPKIKQQKKLADWWCRQYIDGGRDLGKRGWFWKMMQDPIFGTLSQMPADI